MPGRTIHAGLPRRPDCRVSIDQLVTYLNFKILCVDIVSPSTLRATRTGEGGCLDGQREDRIRHGV
jgi:hypothetical protein